MKTHILTGSKQEIAERLVQMNGDVREAIDFEEVAAQPSSDSAQRALDDLFAEMTPFMMDVPAVDDSREAIYSPMGEE